MDEVILSRMDTEWLVAWFYGRSRQVPPMCRSVSRSSASSTESISLPQADVGFNRADRTPSRRVAIQLETDPKERAVRVLRQLEAQNQCRVTLETLATFKTPLVVFARQTTMKPRPRPRSNPRWARVQES